MSYSNMPSFVIPRRAYLGFRLGFVTGDLTSAVLRLYGVYPGLVTTDRVLVVWSTGEDGNGGASGNGDEATLT